MNNIELFILFIFGLCWGSFLNVVIIRTLSGESIVSPPSKCPHCSNKLLWWQNIPILSYLILKGRCHFCKNKISIQYPFVEVLGVVIVLFSFIKYNSIIDSVAIVLILSMFVTLSFTDIKINKISPAQTLIIMLSGILFNRHDLLNSLAGYIFSAAIIIFLSVIGLKLLKKETFGTGDVYMFGALGAVIGLDKLFLFLIYTLFIQFLLILPKYVISLIKNKRQEILKYLIFFTIACLFLYVLRNISFYASNLVLTIVLACIIYYAYKIIKYLLLSVKTQETTLHCPLAPAIALSCLIFLC